MHIYPTRAALAAMVLAELGALTGAAMCAAFIVGRLLLDHDTLGTQTLLGALIWGAVVGGPIGALALPALGLTVLRRTPLRRALGYPCVGTITGLAAAAILLRAAGVWPVPTLVPVFGLGGLLVGVAAARGEFSRRPESI